MVSFHIFVSETETESWEVLWTVSFCFQLLLVFLTTVEELKSKQY